MKLSANQEMLYRNIGKVIRETVEQRAAALETVINRLEAANTELRKRIERLEKKGGAGGAVRLIR